MSTVDISDKEYLLPTPVLQSMYKASKHMVGLKEDTSIKTGVKDSNEVIKYSKVKQMVEKLRKKRDDKGITPENVWIKVPKKTLESPTATADWKNDSIIKIVISKIGDFNTGTELIEKLRAYAKSKKGLYKYYLDSKFIGINQEIKAFTNGLLGNCVDWCQFLKYILTKMGYAVDYIQIQCTSVTHLIDRVSGKEFKDKTLVDIAAIIDYNSSYCAIGKKCWCSNGATISVNPNWMNE